MSELALWKSCTPVSIQSFQTFSVQRRTRDYQVAVSFSDNFIDPFKLNEEFGWSRIFQIPPSYYEAKKSFIDLKLSLALNLIEQRKVSGTKIQLRTTSEVEQFLTKHYITGTWIADGRDFTLHVTCEKDGEILYMISFAPWQDGVELIRVCSMPDVRMHKINDLITVGMNALGVNELTLRARLQFFNADVAVGKSVFGRQVISQDVNLAEKSLTFKIA